MTQPISVLIVDDHPVVRRGLRVLLEVQDGIEVAGEAGDGATALALAAEHAPDVILLDLKLPGMDGIAVLGELRPAIAPPGCSCSPAPPNPRRRAWRSARARRGCSTRTSTRTRWCGRSARCTTATCCSPPRQRAPWSVRRAAGAPDSGRRPGRAHQPRARGTRRTRQGPVQPGDRAGPERLGEDGEGARELGAGQARRAGPHPGRAARGQAPAGSVGRPGAQPLDQVGVDDDVVQVVAGGLVEGAAAGDQPQAGVTGLAVDSGGREGVLGDLLHPVHGEGGDLPVGQRDVDPVPGVQVLEVVEHRDAGERVHVAEDDRRRRAGRAPGRTGTSRSGCDPRAAVPAPCRPRSGRPPSPAR